MFGAVLKPSRKAADFIRYDLKPPIDVHGIGTRLIRHPKIQKMTKAAWIQLEHSARWSAGFHSSLYRILPESEEVNGASEIGLALTRDLLGNNCRSRGFMTNNQAPHLFR